MQERLDQWSHCYNSFAKEPWNKINSYGSRMFKTQFTVRDHSRTIRVIVGEQHTVSPVTSPSSPMFCLRSPELSHKNKKVDWEVPFHIKESFYIYQVHYSYSCWPLCHPVPLHHFLLHSFWPSKLQDMCNFWTIMSSILKNGFTTYTGRGHLKKTKV